MVIVSERRVVTPTAADLQAAQELIESQCPHNHVRTIGQVGVDFCYRCTLCDDEVKPVGDGTFITVEDMWAKLQSSNRRCLHCGAPCAEGVLMGGCPNPKGEDCGHAQGWHHPDVDTTDIIKWTKRAGDQTVTITARGAGGAGGVGMATIESVTVSVRGGGGGGGQAAR